jgi:hypothetical protein
MSGFLFQEITVKLQDDFKWRDFIVTRLRPSGIVVTSVLMWCNTAVLARAAYRARWLTTLGLSIASGGLSGWILYRASTWRHTHGNSSVTITPAHIWLDRLDGGEHGITLEICFRDGSGWRLRRNAGQATVNAPFDDPTFEQWGDALQRIPAAVE